jgi:hypothetical protein
MVGWLPWVFCLSASSSLTYLRDFLPSLLAGLSKISSSEELTGSIIFFLAMSAYEGEGAASRDPTICPCSPVSFLFGGDFGCTLLSIIIFGSSVSLLRFSACVAGCGVGLGSPSGFSYSSYPWLSLFVVPLFLDLAVPIF